MQTFLPYPDFFKSAKCLDRKRLGKQRVEVLQILRAIKQGGGWRNHPATRMWRGYEGALVMYGEFIVDRWLSLGYKDTCLNKMFELVNIDQLTLPVLPHWLGDTEFHQAHQSNLLRKDPEWYGQFGWDVPDDLPYVWPV
jgi:hypothetical protein